MATLYSISENVRTLIEGGDPSNAPKFEMEEIKRAVIQVVNGMIKTQYLTDEMAGGETIPDGSVLAEYDNVAVEKYKNTARAELPAMPVKLPRNMGVYHVGKTDDIITGFIPFQAGQLQMIGEQPLISDILGQVGYEQRGKYLVFDRDITTNQDEYRITAVYILLVVKDLSLYGDFDLLPIPASMDFEVIMNTFQALTGKMPQNKVVDVINKKPEGQA
jgi:hypothetical protein